MTCFMLLLSSCSSSNPNKTPNEVIQNLWSSTINSGVGVEISKVAFHNLSVSDAPAGSISLITSPNEIIGGDGEFDLINNNGSFTLNTPNFGPIEMDITKGSFYLHFPANLLIGALAKKPWLYVDSSTLSAIKSPSLLAVAQLFDVMDPAYSLNFIKGFSGNAVKLGKEVIDKFECTNYVYSINITKAADSFSGITKNTMLQVLKLTHVSNEQITTCVDSSNKAIQSTFSVNLNQIAYPVPGNPLATEKLSGFMTVTESFSSFVSGSMNTKSPPSNQVINLNSIIKNLNV